MGGHPNSLFFWQPLLDKISKKLDRWKRFNISRGGRLTLCSSVLSSIPLYYFSMFVMPSQVSIELERMLQNFFWEGNDGGKINHLVRWNLVTKAPKDGCLDFGALKHRNLALVAKWGWRQGDY